VARSRLGQWALLLIGSCTLWWRSKYPRGSAFYGSSARDGSSAPERGRRKSEALPSAPRGIRSILSDERGCRTAGCERGFVPWQVATRLLRARDRSAADTVRIDAQRKWHTTSMRVQAARLRSGESRLRGSLASLNSDCQKTGESNFHCQQRRTLHAASPSTLSNSTNGWLTWQRRSYSEDDSYLGLRIHRSVKEREFIGDSRCQPVENECITAGKTVRMQQELCVPRRTLLSRRHLRPPR
jgi:hypothetical protein